MAGGRFRAMPGAMKALVRALRFGLAAAAAVAALALVAAPASAAEDWRRHIAAGRAALEAGAAEPAILAFRRALDGGAPGRERGRAYQGLVRALLLHRNLDAAEAALAEAMGFVKGAFGPDDLLMAGLWQLQGAIALQRRDRERALAAFAEATRIRNVALGHVWSRLDAPPRWRHGPSGVSVPERAGALALAGRNVTDDEGRDVSAQYRGALAAGAVTATVFVYRPRLADFAAVFAEEVAAIRRLTPAVEAKGEAALSVAAGARRIAGRMAAFAYESEGARLGTRLYLFAAAPGVLVKLRITYRAEDDGAVEAEAAALLAALGWPE
jgi:tetratricopeptide (TPR) repeat protein